MQHERFFPVDPDRVFEALVAAVHQEAKFRGRDDVHLGVFFGTKISAWSWGATVSAQVVPVPGGAIVRATGRLSMSSNLAAKGPEHRNLDDLFDVVDGFLGLPPETADERSPVGGRPSSATRWRVLSLTVLVGMMLVFGLLAADDSSPAVSRVLYAVVPFFGVPYLVVETRAVVRRYRRTRARKGARTV